VGGRLPATMAHGTVMINDGTVILGPASAIVRGKGLCQRLFASSEIALKGSPATTEMVGVEARILRLSDQGVPKCGPFPRVPNR
jgi:hypothetical protein